MKTKLTISEKRIIGKIRAMVNFANGKQYMFIFIYSDIGMAINWEGGYDLPMDKEFRNQYTLEHAKKLVKNW